MTPCSPTRYGLRSKLADAANNKAATPWGCRFVLRGDFDIGSFAKKCTTLQLPELIYSWPVQPLSRRDRCRRFWHC